MRIKNIDHFVITTKNLEDCLNFYVNLLGMEHKEKDGHHSVVFGDQKINIHTRPKEFLPAAENITYGCMDYCLITDTDLEGIVCEIKAFGYPIEEGIVKRTGACGPMNSIYLRDPDGNLVEISSYIA